VWCEFLIYASRQKEYKEHLNNILQPNPA